MRRVLILLLLTGCAVQDAQLRPPAAVEVDKIVTVRCVKSVPVRPVYSTETLPAATTDIQYGDALAGDWVQSRRYERELELAVQACLN